jgi:hypothetical protein
MSQHRHGQHPQSSALRSPEARGSVNEPVMLRRYRGPLAVRRVGYGACEIVELRLFITRKRDVRHDPL